MTDRVLVTGGARSIGRGIVERLQQDGYEVVILDRVAPEPATAARWIEVDLMDGEATDAAVRSEEHTSELQSLMRISYAVFCLKKKKKTISKTSIKNTHRH